MYVFVATARSKFRNLIISRLTVFKTVIIFFKLIIQLTVKVHGSGSVGVDFVDHLIQFFVGHVVVQFGQYFSQNFSCYVTVSCPKSFVFNVYV